MDETGVKTGTISLRKKILRWKALLRAGIFACFLLIFGYGLVQLDAILSNPAAGDGAAEGILAGATQIRTVGAAYSMAAPGGFRQLFSTPFFHVVFYTFIALAIVWILLYLQSRKMRDESTDLRTRVHHLSKELEGAREEFAREIAEYRAMLNAASENERAFRNLYETTGTPTVVMNEDTTIAMVNGEFERLTGYNRVNIEGRLSLTEFVHPDDVARVLDHHRLRRVEPSRTPTSCEFRFLTPAGDIRSAIAYVSILPGGRQSIVSLMDLTEKKRAEQHIRLLAHAMQSVSECVSITDLDDRILFVNSAFLETYGYEPDELTGKCIRDMRPADDASIPDILEKTLHGGWHGEILNVRKSGQTFPIELSTSVVLDDNGAPAALVGIAEDITVRREETTRLTRLNECMLAFGSESVQNINRLVALSGELLGGDCAFYNRLEEDVLRSVGMWRAPEGAGSIDQAQGHVCFDLIGEGTTTVRLFRALQASAYRETDPIVRDYGFETYLGATVSFGGAVVGSLCVLYAGDAFPSESDFRLLAVVATAIGVEEERNRSAEALRRSEERYRSLFENAVTGVYRTTIEGTITDCNDAFARILGAAAREDLVGMNSVRFYHNPKSREHFVEELRRTGMLTSHEVLLRRTDGAEVWALLSTRLLDDGSILGTMVDISRRKDAERALQDSETRYRLLFENNPFPMWVFDSETHAFLAVNEAAVAHYGYSREEFLGMNIRDIRPREDVPRLLDTILRKGDDIDHAGVWRHHKKDGSEILVEITAHPLMFAGRRAEMVLADDITERVRTEEQKRRYTEELQQLNASKDKFFSIISHDLRSPLSTLHGYAEMLAGDSESFGPETIKTIAGSMYSLTHRVHALLENLLEWSRLQAGRMEYQPIKIDMHELVDDVIDLLRESALRKNIDIRVRLNGHSYARADQRMIRSVVQNLLTNAVKFNRRDGVITVDAEQNGDTLVVSVSDNGVGISPEAVDRLFRIDVNHSTPGTADEQGSGLGLILCKELVEMNHGRIWVESSPGEGSTFSFSLPYWANG